MILLRKSVAIHQATTRRDPKTGKIVPVKAFSEKHRDAAPAPAKTPVKAKGAILTLVRTPAKSVAVAASKTRSSRLDKPITEVKAAEIATRPDLMQFKHIENADGTNGQDAIKGKWNNLYAGVITIWKPEDPKAYGLKRGEKYIVVNGHHRLSKAKDFKVDRLRVQVLYEGKGPDKETSGITALTARRIGAEINIVDGKGSIYDQVKFLRDQRAVVGKDRSLERAREIGIGGGQAATIAFDAKDSLYSAFFAERVTPQQAEQIATAAPGDEDLQRLGVKEAIKGKSGPALFHFLMAVRAMRRDKEMDAQMDMFGNSDSAINQATDMAGRAASIQREIKDRIAAVAGAASRPEKARELGVNVTDASATLKEVVKLKAERDKWSKWYLYPTLIAQTKTGPGSLVKALAASYARLLGRG